MGKAIEIIKKNGVSVICGVVAILAIVATFIVAGRFNTQLNQKLADSQATYKKVQELNTATFKQPDRKSTRLNSSH